MYKIAILGCENTHANTFLDFVIKDKLYSDIEVVGVYSDDKEAADKLGKQYGIYVSESYEEFVGKVDGIIITARHGDKHYKYAKPYIASGIPMFIDKPITISEEEARQFKNELVKTNIKICGGSVCKFAAFIQLLKRSVEQKSYGEVYGGYLRAPVSMENPHGGFFFYSQHLVEVMCEIFGFYPNSVMAFRNGNVVNCVVRYNQYDVNLSFVDGNYDYYAGIDCENNAVFSKYVLDGCFEYEFDSFYRLLKGENQPKTYEDFFAPVFIMNAIDRSLKNGREEKVERQ